MCLITSHSDYLKQKTLKRETVDTIDFSVERNIKCITGACDAEHSYGLLDARCTISIFCVLVSQLTTVDLGPVVQKQ